MESLSVPIDHESSRGRAASIIYDLGLMVCGAWVLFGRASWSSVCVFIVGCLAGLAVFSNWIWPRSRYVHKRLDAAVALVGSALLMGFPAILLLNGAERIRCLICLGVFVATRLLMRAPPTAPLFKRRRGRDR